MPAGMWGSNSGVSGLNRTYQWIEYRKAVVHNSSTEISEDLYMYRACNVSSLLFGVFVESTSFADQFAVSYINNRKEKELSHVFTSDDWSDLGYAQWGSGAITYAISRVNQFIRLNEMVCGSLDRLIIMAKYRILILGSNKGIECFYTKIFEPEHIKLFHRAQNRFNIPTGHCK